MKRFTYQKLYSLLTILSGWFPYRFLINRKVMIGTSLLLLTGAQAIAQSKHSSLQKAIDKEEVEDSELDVTCYVIDFTKIVVVDKMPEFPGDVREYIKKHLQYPEDICVHGRVIVQFIVNEDGSISDEVVVRSIHPELDKNALELVRNMPRWIPGTKEGVAVKVKYTLPITYEL